MIKNILLVCMGGFSTSMLVERMKEAARSMDLEVNIEAESVRSVASKADSIDVLMLGPQAAHAEESLKAEYGDKFPILIIDSMDYGMMNGQKVLEEALKNMK